MYLERDIHRGLSIFRRVPEVPENLEYRFNLAVKNSITDENRKLFSEVTAEINTEQDPVYVKVKCVGIFSVTDESNMDIKQFAENNAASIVYPYIREEIHGRMLKAGLPKTLILPPLNFIALPKKPDKDSGT